jgi:hypothetical protein
MPGDATPLYGETARRVDGMLIPLLILAGLFLWATGHLILR